MAEKLSMAAISRAWQMLLKGLQEVQTAPMPLIAVEMLLVRLVYVSDLPDPAALLRQAKGEAPVAGSPAPSNVSMAPGTQTTNSVAAGVSAPTGHSAQTHPAQAQPADVPEPEPVARADTSESPTLNLPDFAALVSLVERQREPTLHATADWRCPFGSL